MNHHSTTSSPCRPAREGRAAPLFEFGISPRAWRRSLSPPVPFSACILAVALSLAGCGGGHDHAHDHGHKEKESHAGHAHTHDAKHGGVALVLGEEEYHIEFAYAETPGVLQAYFFDGEMENYVRVAAASFDTVARLGDEERPLVFHATTNSATGETVGNTALFEARAEWLVSRPLLTLTIPKVTVKNSTYTQLTVPLSADPKKHAQNTP